jgi:uncharacterized lipoprotein YehR (DUF1307 family)
MKKFLSVILASVLVVSLAACSKDNTKDAKQGTNTPAAADQKKDEFKPKEVTKFADILDNMGNKDYYFVDSSVIKITSDTKVYNEKVNKIVTDAMKEKNVDVKTSAKTYNYYKNVNGNKEHKVYVVVFDANKAPIDLYEVSMTISDKDEPALKDVKKVDNAINEAFKTNFAKEVK